MDLEGSKGSTQEVQAVVKVGWIKGDLQDSEDFYSTLGLTLLRKIFSFVLLTSLGSWSLSIRYDQLLCTSASLQGLSIPTRLSAQE